MPFALSHFYLCESVCANPYGFNARKYILVRGGAFARYLIVMARVFRGAPHLLVKTLDELFDIIEIIKEYILWQEAGIWGYR